MTVRICLARGLPDHDPAQYEGTHEHPRRPLLAIHQPFSATAGPGFHAETRRPQAEDCHIYGKDLLKDAEYVDSIS
jgi:hypothetical protein